MDYHDAIAAYDAAIAAGTDLTVPDSVCFTWVADVVNAHRAFAYTPHLR
jgi:hypothetical protein